MPTSPITTFTNLKLEPAMRPDLVIEMPVKLPASVNYARGTVLGEIVGTNARQSLTPSTGANQITGGTYTISFGGHTTANILADAPAGDIQTALETLMSIGVGNVHATGGQLAGSVIYIEFVGALAGAAQGAITAAAGGLTSPGTAAITVNSTLQVGAAGSPGTFRAYAIGNTDGSQTPRAILTDDVQTDSTGAVTFSDTSGQTVGEFGQSYPTASAYIAGHFNTTDLTGLDTYALAAPGFALKQGTLANGLLRLS